MTDPELRIKSIQYRKKLLACIKKAGAGHTGGDLSCLDILNVLYNRILDVSPERFDDPGRDRYVQSKGHSVEALYVVLADRGFFPEADLLRAYSEFLMCKFSDASKSMDRFVERYTPLKQELDASLPAMSPADGWADGVAMQKGEAPKLPKSVLRSFALEERFAKSMEAVADADEELTRLGSLQGHAISARATGWVQGRRDAIVQEEGGRVLGRARYAQSELADMLEGIELTRLDLLNLETQMYEKAAATGQLEFGDKIGKLREMRKNRKGARVWPFEGEFWADELGWYVIDARPDCPDAMAQGQ